MKTRMCLQLESFSQPTCQSFEDRLVSSLCAISVFFSPSRTVFLLLQCPQTFRGSYESHWDLLLGQTHTHRYLLDKLYAS